MYSASSASVTRKRVGGERSAPDGKFPVKPEGTNLGPILIARAMCYESGGRNGHKILRGFAGRPAKGEGIFTNRSLIFKPTVL
jgi:hypothetical protein